MSKEITPIPCRPWTLNGISDRLIVSHYPLGTRGRAWRREGDSNSRRLITPLP